MKPILIVGICFSTLCPAQMGINTPTPDSNSDITLGSTSKGLLLNRVPLTSGSTNVFSRGMLIYNTSTINDVVPGSYLSNGTVWNKIVELPELNSQISTTWKITGNPASASDFIGTTNSQPFVIRTNNTEKARIDTEGRLGIGTNSPLGIVDITSANSTLVLPRNTNPTANVVTPAAGMVIYDSTNRTLRYYNGTQWNTLISSTTVNTSNEGVVRINSGAGVKPTFAFRTSGGIPLNTYQNVAYSSVNLATDLAAFPTTSWPENIASPTAANIYNQTTGRFLDNSIPGQVHTWRVITRYDNKNNGSIGFVTINLSNSNSTLSLDQTSIAPNGGVSGTLVFYFVTIADSNSIANGYSFRVKSDTAMDVIIDSITRVSQAKD